MIFTTEQALLSILVVLTSCSSAMANQNYNQQIIIGRIHSTKYPVFQTTSRRQQQQQTTTIASIISPSSALLLVNLRGGSGSFCTPSPFLDMEAEESSDEEQEEDDDYMDDIDEDEGAAMHQQRQRQNLKSTSSHRQPSERSEVDPDPFHRKAPYLARKKKKKNVLSRMATSSLSLTKKAATTTVKTSGKAAFYLMRPKAIQESELWGVWRLDQQVGMKQCTANIELTKRGDVVVRSGNNIIWKARYRFVQPTWPQSCRIEFEAPAFQPPNSKKSWMLRYKGTIERKMADKSVVSLQQFVVVI